MLQVLAISCPVFWGSELSSKSELCIYPPTSLLECREHSTGTPPTSLLNCSSHRPAHLFPELPAVTRNTLTSFRIPQEGFSPDDPAASAWPRPRDPSGGLPAVHRPKGPLPDHPLRCCEAQSGLLHDVPQHQAPCVRSGPGAGPWIAPRRPTLPGSLTVPAGGPPYLLLLLVPFLLLLLFMLPLLLLLLFQRYCCCYCCCCCSGGLPLGALLLGSSAGMRRQGPRPAGRATAGAPTGVARDTPGDGGGVPWGTACGRRQSPARSASLSWPPGACWRVMGEGGAGHTKPGGTWGPRESLQPGHLSRCPVSGSPWAAWGLATGKGKEEEESGRQKELPAHPRRPRPRLRPRLRLRVRAEGSGPG